jgi:hypothetical protein
MAGPQSVRQGEEPPRGITRRLELCNRLHPRRVWDEMDAIEPFILRNYLLFFLLPVWIVAGAADWWCHRRAGIERFGVYEPLLHLTLLSLAGLPILLGLFLATNAPVLLVMIVCMLHWQELVSDCAAAARSVASAVPASSAAARAGHRGSHSRPHLRRKHHPLSGRAAACMALSHPSRRVAVTLGPRRNQDTAGLLL